MHAIFSHIVWLWNLGLSYPHGWEAKKLNVSGLRQNAENESVNGNTSSICKQLCVENQLCEALLVTFTLVSYLQINALNSGLHN